MKKLFFITLFIVSGSLGMAQSADSYFHGGAQSFINADLQGAIAQVQQGLAQYPNDSKLNALLQKLEEEKEKQEQQQQQNQQNQDQQEQDQEQQQNQDQQQQDQEEQENEEQQDQQEGEQNEQNEPQEQEGQAQQPREISKEEAEKILKALAQKEKELLKEFKKQKPQGSATHDKDW
ncbi:MAG: hypothetical protein BalsKO_26010 [Balneolaceae bacterium]